MDVEIYESSNGGDIVKNAKDLSVIYGFENFVYLALFGGNIDASTPTTRLPTEQAFDFWGNNLLLQGNAAAQFNSETERALSEFPLTSNGRIQIETAIKKDLEFMKAFAEVKVVTQIVATDKLLIGISLKQPDNAEAKDYIYIWDATRQELYARENADFGGGNVPPEIKNIFDKTFDKTFN